jgi:Fe2+ or Zn2+ uptake regulation protein
LVQVWLIRESKTTGIASYFADFASEISTKDGLKLRCQNVKLFLHEPLIMDAPRKATVYKTISLAKEMGVVMELEFSQGSNRYDGKRPYPHPHVICTKCKQVMDADDFEIEALKQQIVRKTGYRIVNHRIDFFGICPDCQKMSTHQDG